MSTLTLDISTGLVNVLYAPDSCQADCQVICMPAAVKFLATPSVLNAVPASYLAGCFRQAFHDDRSIQAGKRAVIPILRVCAATTSVCSCRRGHKPQGYYPDEPNLNLS